MKFSSIVFLSLVSCASFKSPQKQSLWLETPSGIALTRSLEAVPAKLDKKPWQWRDKNAIGAAPQSFARLTFVDDERVLIPTLGGGLSFVDLRTNSRIWEKEYPVGVASDVFLLESSVVVATMDSVVQKIKLSDGSLEWSSKISAESTGGVSGTEQMLYVTAADNSLWSLDAKTGRALWTYKRPNTGSGVLWSLRGAATPVLSPDKKVLYAGFSDGTFVALKAETGDTIWERSFERPGRFKDCDTTPVLSRDGKKIFLSVVDSELQALNSANGQTLWNLPLASHYSPLVNEEEGVLYYSTNDNKFRKVSLQSGNILWVMDLGNKGVASTPVVLDQKYLALTTTRFGLLVIDKDNGSIVHTNYLGQGILAPPAFRNARLLLLSPKNDLMIFRWLGPSKGS
jgi:outer membrane protein assembly factor BamB